MTTSFTTEGFLRGLGVFLIIAVLSAAGNIANLGFLNPATASLVAAFALWLEGYIKTASGSALFGASKA